MKQLLISLVAVLISMATLNAQQIAVVGPSGATTTYTKLIDAIKAAAPNSTIYLPGGGFQVSADVKINKKITIIGTTHKANSTNSDGNTVISGNLQFTEGSSGSAVMGVYLHGNVKVGVDGAANNILVRYCNVNAFEVSNGSYGLKVNQSYIRSNTGFGDSNAEITNSVTNSISGLNGGKLQYNIIAGGFDGGTTNSVLNNIFSGGFNGDMNRNNISGDFNTLFVKWDGVKTTSDLHFKEDYEGRKDVGIYGGGTRFSENCLPPMPHIISKSVAERTDSKGMLKVQMTINN